MLITESIVGQIVLSQIGRRKKTKMRINSWLQQSQPLLNTPTAESLARPRAQVHRSEGASKDMVGDRWVLRVAAVQGSVGDRRRGQLPGNQNGLIPGSQSGGKAGWQAGRNRRETGRQWEACLRISAGKACMKVKTIW